MSRISEWFMLFSVCMSIPKASANFCISNPNDCRRCTKSISSPVYGFRRLGHELLHCGHEQLSINRKVHLFFFLCEFRDANRFCFLPRGIATLVSFLPFGLFRPFSVLILYSLILLLFEKNFLRKMT